MESVEILHHLESYTLFRPSILEQTKPAFEVATLSGGDQMTRAARLVMKAHPLERVKNPKG